MLGTFLSTLFVTDRPRADKISVYYALAIIWPSQVAVLYTDDGGASMYAGFLSCCPSAFITFGMIVSGFLAEPIGKTKFQCIIVLTAGGAFLGGKNPSLLGKGIPF